MALDNDVLKTVADKKFTDFSNAVKQELKSKLGNSKSVKTYVSDFDKLQQMKGSFAEISKSLEKPGKEPEKDLKKDPKLSDD